MKQQVPGRVVASTDRSVLTLTFERPPLNVLDLALLDGLHTALDEAARDPALCAIVLRGSGQAFSAGVDIADHRPESARRMLREMHDVVRALAREPAVTIAAVKGFCLGGGLELAMSCDLVIAEPGATLGQPEIKVGCFPPVACARLASVIGPARAADIILTGQPLSSEQALEMGMISRLGPLDRTLEEVLGTIRAQSRAVLRATVEAMRAATLADLDRRLAETEEIYVRRLIGSEDMSEGIEAFLEKRAPRWKHR
jgi:cyclohexa-1,5-dienecarbonyl-CoA hydratase